MTPVNTGDDYSGDFAKEGNVAKDNHFATKGDLAKDGRLAFSLDVDITNVGNFPKEGDVSMTSASAKRALLLTKAISATKCGFVNGVEVAKDGTLAIDGDLAKGKKLHQGGQCYHEGQLCRGRLIAFTMAINFAEVGKHFQGGQLCHKGRLFQGRCHC
jgi:hypothetical protein